jgi:anthranilate synthase component 2/putative glutamine amidotransferase
MSQRPLVGVSTYVETATWRGWSRPAALLPLTYVEAVYAAGGVPILLPPPGVGTGLGPAAQAGAQHSAHRAVGALDALVLAGGPDIDPASYGAAPHPKTTGVRPERDTWEFDLLAAALERDLPTLGICRGMELMNVACGGDLIQHLPDHGADANHRPAPSRYGQHRVRLDGGPLSAALGSERVVASYHHQGVGRIGTGLRPVAWADDDIVEALELAGARFAVGVLWHPEEDERSSGKGVIAALVEAAT